jgi:hypothetical protein
MFLLIGAQYPAFVHASGRWAPKETTMRKINGHCGRAVLMAIAMSASSSAAVDFGQEPYTPAASTAGWVRQEDCVRSLEMSGDGEWVVGCDTHGISTPDVVQRKSPRSALTPPAAGGQQRVQLSADRH